jgi:hypothetical protein
MAPVRDRDDTDFAPHMRETTMTDRDEHPAPNRPERRRGSSDPEPETASIDPGSGDDVAVIPDVDDLEERYRLLRELRGLGRCVGLEA